MFAVVVIRGGGRFKDLWKQRYIQSIVISLKCFQEGLEALWCFSFAGVQWDPGEQGLAVQRGFATWWPGFLYSLVPGGISYLPSGSWPLQSLQANIGGKYWG